MTPVFRLDQITKRFGKQVALDHVSLESEPGEVVALLGENGAGKTTAIRILLGLLEPDSGRADVLGLDSTRQGNEVRRRVGYVADRPTFYEWMTVAEIGWFAAGFYDRRFLPHYRDLVAAFELPVNRKMKALSKGMRAKVALSLAMAHEPELLVLDEPTSGLDPMVRREFLESMVDVAATGRTVLLSSHQISEVERVADVVAILRHGKLAAIERLNDLKRDVRELTITFQNGSTELPRIAAEIISRQRVDRQWKLLARCVDEDVLGELRAGSNVRNVEARTPSLEEIFVGYMHAGGDPVGNDRPNGDHSKGGPDCT